MHGKSSVPVNWRTCTSQFNDIKNLLFFFLWMWISVLGLTCSLVRVCCSCVEMCSSRSLASLCPIKFRYSLSIWIICKGKIDRNTSWSISKHQFPDSLHHSKPIHYLPVWLPLSAFLGCVNLLPAGCWVWSERDAAGSCPLGREHPHGLLHRNRYIHSSSICFSRLANKQLEKR